MKVTVSKWGNSLGLRVPKTIAEEMQLVEGVSLLLIPAPGGGYLLRPEDQTAPYVRYSLSDLVREMQPDGRTELDWGPPRGDEVW